MAPRPEASRSSVRRLALSKSEASRALGVSVDFFDEHIQPAIKIVRVGRRRLISVRELEAYLERTATRALEIDR